MKKEKVESILTTARHLFGRYGIQKTNLDDVARQSKVAKATIYNYFGNKEKVYLEVLNREIGDMATRISAAIAQAGSPNEKLRIFMQMSFNLVKEKTEDLNIQAGTIHRFILDGDQIRERLFDQQAAILEGILKEGVQTGIFPKSDPSTVHAILYAMRGFEFTSILDPANKAIEADLDRFFDLLSNGLLKTKENAHA